MTAKDKIIRLHELLGTVLNGLEGKPFSWGDGQRKAWVSLLRGHGVTLVTETQVKKQGLRLKRGAKPVGRAYFGAPIRRTANLYVLEVQCLKPTLPDTDCWLFLDCEVMTGKPAAKCPNRKQCKQQAIASPNRKCDLQYTYQRWEPEKDQLFKHKENWLRVNYDCPEEAKAYGWHEAQRLFYEYDLENKWLKVNGLIPKEAEELGWATALHVPWWKDDPQSDRLVVMGYSPMSSYPDYFQQNGWYPATELPFYIQSFWDDDKVKVLKVCFSTDNPEYAEAIALGWYPATPVAIRRDR